MKKIYIKRRKNHRPYQLSKRRASKIGQRRVVLKLFFWLGLKKGVVGEEIMGATQQRRESKITSGRTGSHRRGDRGGRAKVILDGGEREKG